MLYFKIVAIGTQVCCLFVVVSKHSIRCPVLPHWCGSTLDVGGPYAHNRENSSSKSTKIKTERKLKNYFATLSYLNIFP